MDTRQHNQQQYIIRIYGFLQVFFYNSWITKFPFEEPIDSAISATNSNKKTTRPHPYWN